MKQLIGGGGGEAESHLVGDAAAEAVVYTPHPHLCTLGMLRLVLLHHFSGATKHRVVAGDFFLLPLPLQEASHARPSPQKDELE